MIDIIIGKSASGKDTFLKKLVACGERPVVSYTTRPMREGEQDGVDYYFVTPEGLHDLVSCNRLAEVRSYNTLVQGKPDIWYYASPLLTDIEDVGYVVVLDIQGAKEWLRIYGSRSITIWYMMADDEVREERAKNRGSFDQTEWDRRKADDDIKFSREAIAELEELYGKKLLYIDNNK